MQLLALIHSQTFGARQRCCTRLMLNQLQFMKLSVRHTLVSDVLRCFEILYKFSVGLCSGALLCIGHRQSYCWFVRFDFSFLTNSPAFHEHCISKNIGYGLPVFSDLSLTLLLFINV